MTGNGSGAQEGDVIVVVMNGSVAVNDPIPRECNLATVVYQGSSACVTQSSPLSTVGNASDGEQAV